METIYHERYSFAEFSDRMRKPGRECLQWSGTTGEGVWFGTDSYEEAVALFENGWPEGTERLKSAKLVLPPVTEDAFAFTPHYDVSGSEVDVGRFLAGEQDNMLDYSLTRVRMPGRVVKFVMSVSVSSGLNADAFLRRGLMVLRLVDALESSGYRCELSLADCLRHNGERQVLEVIAKEPDQAIETDRLAFMLMHIAFYRRLFFRLSEQTPEHNFRLFERGGSPISYPLPVDDTVIVIPKLHLYQQAEVDAFEKQVIAKYLEPEAQLA